MILCVCSMGVFAQNNQSDTLNSVVFGHVSEKGGDAIEAVNIVIFGMAGVGTTTDEKGNYSLNVPALQKVTLVFTHVGHKDVVKSFMLQTDGYYRFDPVMDVLSLDSLVITADREREKFIVSVPIEPLEYIPDPSGDPIIAALKQMGAVSNNELSSQYSVRGGNFDENLVYVNDFEIYRPLLTRSGQQEGFSFPNYNMTKSIAFSAGGFQARYGDKLSSVLDIKYKRPKEFNAGFSASLMGGTAFVEVADSTQKHGAMIGVRYQNNAYLLNTLETTGEYTPSFTDIQGLYAWKLSDKLDLEVLGNYSRNRYTFIPKDRSTSTGVVNDVVRLDVFFDGQQRNTYDTGMGGISLAHHPNKRTMLKWMVSAYRAVENENFDIIGDYWLGAVEESLGNEDFGQVQFGLGVGTFQNYARNTIDSKVGNIGHIGQFERGNNYLEWGARYQREDISDRYNEWERLDSAGYSLPYSDQEVLLNNVVKSSTELSSNRYNAYLQNTWSQPRDSGSFSINGGIRLSYWDLNKEFLASPRMQFALRPNWLKTDSTARDIRFKAAAGLYVQPPFYREMRNLEGEVNTDLKAQKSVHFVLGSDVNFLAWGRPFKFVSELYYKYLFDLVPYEIDNVRIRYYGENLSTGYATGVDLRLYGELVDGADSWVTVSVLKTQEDLSNDSYIDAEGTLIEPGFIARPTDQRVNFGMFFQDYFPNHEEFKVHLNFLYGTGLPFGPPASVQLKNAFRAPPYRRVDIGFSAVLLKKPGERKNQAGFFKNLESIWTSLEVFNLLGIDNTISYVWVKDTNNTVYAFPNTLTGRRLNLRFIVKI